jgi:hypothetical protein
MARRDRWDWGDAVGVHLFDDWPPNFSYVCLALASSDF